MTSNDSDRLARLIYETATEGYDVTPWQGMSPLRKWRWLRAAEKAAAFVQAPPVETKTRTVRLVTDTHTLRERLAARKSGAD